MKTDAKAPRRRSRSTSRRSRSTSSRASSRSARPTTSAKTNKPLKRINAPKKINSSKRVSGNSSRGLRTTGPVTRSQSKRQLELGTAALKAVKKADGRQPIVFICVNNLKVFGGSVNFPSSSEPSAHLSPHTLQELIRRLQQDNPSQLIATVTVENMVVTGGSVHFVSSSAQP